MICKHCGKETANVICDHCGTNVIWYNKYGTIEDDFDSEKSNLYNKITNNSETIEHIIDEIFVPDGSGD